MSPVVRQQLASRPQSAAWSKGAEFDRLKTMSRPHVPQGLAHRLDVRDVDRVPVVLQVVEAPLGPLPGIAGLETSTGRYRKCFSRPASSTRRPWVVARAAAELA